MFISYCMFTRKSLFISHWRLLADLLSLLAVVCLPANICLLAIVCLPANLCLLAIVSLLAEHGLVVRQLMTEPKLQ